MGSSVGSHRKKGRRLSYAANDSGIGGTKIPKRGFGVGPKLAVSKTHTSHVAAVKFRVSEEKKSVRERNLGGLPSAP